MKKKEYNFYYVDSKLASVRKVLSIQKENILKQNLAIDMILEDLKFIENEFINLLRGGV